MIQSVVCIRSLATSRGDVGHRMATHQQVTCFSRSRHFAVERGARQSCETPRQPQVNLRFERSFEPVCPPSGTSQVGVDDAGEGSRATPGMEDAPPSLASPDATCVHCGVTFPHRGDQSEQQVHCDDCVAASERVTTQSRIVWNGHGEPKFHEESYAVTDPSAGRRRSRRAGTRVTASQSHSAETSSLLLSSILEKK